MRPAFRMAMAAATTLALTLPLAGVASADPKPDPVPTQKQVDRARADVASKRQSVDQLEGALAAANARLQQAALDASIAAEAYNGAMWRLSEAKKSVRKAEAQEEQAKKDVKDQRSGIVTFVTDSYQNGTELNSATAVMGGEGPKGLMNRYGVVESAGDSMEAALRRLPQGDRSSPRPTRRRRPRPRSARSPSPSRHASCATPPRRPPTQLPSPQARSPRRRSSWSRRSRRPRTSPSNWPASGSRPSSRSRRRRPRRQPRRRRARRPRRQQLRTHRQGVGAGREVCPARPHPGTRTTASPPASSTGGGYVDPGPPVNGSPPAPGNGAQRAVAYAKAQLGKPYLWAAAGPNSFDCSGLTMMAWRRGGKSLPHWSVAQFQQSTRIGVGSLRAG